MGKKVKKEAEAPPKDVFDPLAVESKKAQTVVLMLDSPEDEILIKACEALYKFAEKCDENRAMLLELGAVERLLKHITSEEKTVRRNSVMVLGVLSTHPDVRRALRKSDCLPNLIKLLGPEEETLVHEFSTLSLSSMAHEYTSKIQILSLDGLSHLINLLSDPDPDVVKNVTQAILLLLEDYQCRIAIRNVQGLEPLLDLLKSEYPVIQELALKSLILCTQDPDNRETLRELEGLEKLLEFVGTKEFEELHVHALLVLSNCLEDIESLELIQSTGGLQKLLTFAAESTIPEIQMNSAKAIARAARNGENCKIFHEQEGERTLIVLLESDSQDVQASAAQALAIMAETAASRSVIAEFDGIVPLIKLLNSDNLDVAESSSLALANLTSGQVQNSVEIGDRNGVEPLIGLLSSTREATQANAAQVLTNMATDEILRADIQKKGVVGALIDPLHSSNTTVQTKAAIALASFVCDVDTRNQLRGLGGLPPLLKLLESGNQEVRRAASWAIVVCANDSLTATEFCKLGGLDVLKEIQQSATRQNSFSEAALERLLDNMLSAKYSLTGQLAVTDIISDGFYDAGKIRPDEKFQTLEELSKREVNQKRPVILVNCGVPRSSPTVTPVPTIPSDGDIRVDSKTSMRPSKSSVKSKRETKREREERELRERLEADRLAEQQALLSQQQSPYEPQSDSKLEEYVNAVTDEIHPLPTTKEQVICLAQFVSQKMGGSIERGQLSNFSYELSISQLKYELKNNIIPIGRIDRGIHYHRALLYKVLADRIGLACTLVRGEYNRAWNEVLLTDDDDNPELPRFPPKPFIVDLIHHPGSLFLSDSPDAINYQKI
ncbi:armadillo repeat-containing protein 3-like [Apostichopus japonicus]|uniref:armadillo repeat-containing protein 3-like n=1 Tax=Stichopus japonicus TaxID=307972 RepID=UPI003AB5D1D7